MATSDTPIGLTEEPEPTNPAMRLVPGVDPLWGKHRPERPFHEQLAIKAAARRHPSSK